MSFFNGISPQILYLSFQTHNSSEQLLSLTSTFIPHHLKLPHKILDLLFSPLTHIPQLINLMIHLTLDRTLIQTLTHQSQYILKPTLCYSFEFL